MAAVQLLLLFFFLSFSALPLPLCLSITEAEALLKFKKSLIGGKPLRLWEPNGNPCEQDDPWVGVSCHGNFVTSLRLSQMGLSGKIDIDALLQLRALRAVSFESNSFSGPIPEFNRLGALKALDLSSNGFSGEIPQDFFLKMGSMKKVWLDGNKFSGKIPDSLGKIQHLIELHLGNNQFSGPIPVMEQKSLASVDVSNNKLEGEIPPSMLKFGRRSFEGNPGLCGKPLDRHCSNQSAAAPKLPPAMVADKANLPAPLQNNSKPAGKSVTGFLVLGFVVTVLVLMVILKSRKNSRPDRFQKLGHERVNEVVEVTIPSSNRGRSVRGFSFGGGSNRRGSSHHRQQGSKNMGDLVMVNEEKGSFVLADLMKAAAEVLGNGALGSAYKAVMSSRLSVVVKRMREINNMSKDSFDAEMTKLGEIRHPNILTPLAYHYRNNEKLIVSEYLPNGSLLYLLHGDRGAGHAELNWPTRLKIIKGVASGMRFLHSEFSSYELPHGNLKSSNILLDSNFYPLLSDYAFYPLVCDTPSAQALFAYKSPEAILYNQNKLTPKADVFCLGIIILELLTAKFPSQYLSNQKGGTDLVQWVRAAVSETELIDPEIVGGGGDANSGAVAEMVKLLHIGAACTETDVDRRIDMAEAIRRIEAIQVSSQGIPELI